MKHENELKSVEIQKTPKSIVEAVKEIHKVCFSASLEGYRAVSLQYVAKKVGVSYGGNFRALAELFCIVNDYAVVMVKEQAGQAYNCLTPVDAIPYIKTKGDVKRD